MCSKHFQLFSKKSQKRNIKLRTFLKIGTVPSLCLQAIQKNSKEIEVAQIRDNHIQKRNQEKIIPSLLERYVFTLASVFVLFVIITFKQQLIAHSIMFKYHVEGTFLQMDTTNLLFIVNCLNIFYFKL